MARVRRAPAIRGGRTSPPEHAFGLPRRATMRKSKKVGHRGRESAQIV